MLWLLAEIAIIATDIAEVIGTAIGLNLIFGIPLELGVVITALDVFLILYLQKLGFRWIEALIITLLGVIAVCFAVQIALADPNWGEVIRGFAPTTEIVTNPEMLYLALGILGATVMPHNLYLHSGIVQTRAYGETLPRETRGAEIRDDRLDCRADVRAARQCLDPDFGHCDLPQSGHERYRRAWRGAFAAVAAARPRHRPDAVRHRASVLRHQLDGDGHACRPDRHGRFPRTSVCAPWLRRLMTRAIAIVPAAIVTIWYGESGTAHLLVLTQVVLSLQLSFAVFPLVMFTADRRKMGALVSPLWLTIFAGVIAVVIVALNAKLLLDFVAA